MLAGRTLGPEFGSSASMLCLYLDHSEIETGGSHDLGGKSASRNCKFHIQWETLPYRNKMVSDRAAHSRSLCGLHTYTGVFTYTHLCNPWTCAHFHMHTYTHHTLKQAKLLHGMNN